jgi:AraC family transcriptional regulator, regulatory protein of adaptative response / DNA-3-methyladenine glycosylase II
MGQKPFTPSSGSAPATDDGRQSECHRVLLPYRRPYDWGAMLAFLRARATPGVEFVTDGTYGRTITVDGIAGWIRISHQRSAVCLQADVPTSQALPVIVDRVRGMFDLGCNPAAVAKRLRVDPLLRDPLARHPGIRLPGAWDGFELAVRAILGQQISVPAATTIAGRIAARFGSPVADGPAPGRLFPTAVQLADAPIERAGVVGSRAGTIRALARRVAEGGLSFGASSDPVMTRRVLKDVPGIGPWTAEYIAMRAFRDCDAFPSGDRVLCRMAGDCTSRELDRRSATWRPWRAYAVMLLWQAATDAAGETRRGRERRRID